MGDGEIGRRSAGHGLNLHTDHIGFVPAHKIAARCQKLLDDRARMLVKYRKGKSALPLVQDFLKREYELSDRLLSAADEAAAKLGPK